MFCFCRYVRVTPPVVQNFNPMPIHLPFHDGVFPQMPRTQANLNYGHPLNPAMASSNAPAYTEWPSVTMTYAQTLNASDPNLFRLASLLVAFLFIVSAFVSHVEHFACRRHQNPWPLVLIKPMSVCFSIDVVLVFFFVLLLLETFVAAQDNCYSVVTKLYLILSSFCIKIPETKLSYHLKAFISKWPGFSNWTGP